MACIFAASFPVTEARWNARVAFNEAAKIILQWDSSTARAGAGEQFIFDCQRNEIDQYLQAVDEILHWIESSAGSDDQSEAENAILMAMTRLEQMSKNILIGHTGPRYSTCSSSLSDSPRYELHDEEYIDYDASSDKAIEDLRCIAERMNSAGYLPRFVQVYKTVRKSMAYTRFGELGVEKLSTGDVRWLEWEVLERKIRQWVRAAKICIYILFASEKRLCERVFGGLGKRTTVDACFMEVIQHPAIQLLNFAEAVSTLRPSLERMFSILDIREALLDLLSALHDFVGSNSNELETIRVQAAEILPRLTDLIRVVLLKFEDAVLHERSMMPAPGGTVHNLTRYVMNYITEISNYEHTLTALIISKPTTDSDDLKHLGTKFLEWERTPLALHLIWIIVILQFQIEKKSKHYKNVALAHLFTMNNVYYIVQKIVRCAKLMKTVGDDHLKELTGKFQEAATSYQRTTWGSLLYCFREEGLYVSRRSLYSSERLVSRSAARERFKSFNTMFDEVRKTQVTWLVPDPQIRKELCISNSQILIPAYRSFVARFGMSLDSYIKYTSEDLEIAVLNFFEERPTFE